MHCWAQVHTSDAKQAERENRRAETLTKTVLSAEGPHNILHAFSGLIIMTGLPGKSSHPITQRRKLSRRDIKGCVPLAQ